MSRLEVIPEVYRLPPRPTNETEGNILFNEASVPYTTIVDTVNRYMRDNPEHAIPTLLQHPNQWLFFLAKGGSIKEGESHLKSSGGIYKLVGRYITPKFEVDVRVTADVAAPFTPEPASRDFTALETEVRFGLIRSWMTFHEELPDSIPSTPSTAYSSITLGREAIERTLGIGLMELGELGRLALAQPLLK